MTAAQRRAAVEHARSFADLSERSACRMLGVARSLCRYRSLRPPRTVERERLRVLAAEKTRWGYRFLHLPMRRKGFRHNWTLTYRVYREEGLSMRRRRRKTRSVILRMVRVPTVVGAVLLLVSELPAQQKVPEWTLRPELRIGAVDGPNALDIVGPIVVSPRTGVVFVTEASQQIVTFDADGRKLASFGRRGLGPGEFKNLIDVYWSDGFVVAIDGATRRATRFTEEGKLVDSRLIESIVSGDAPNRARVVAPYGSDHFLGEMSRGVQAGQLHRTEAWLLKMDVAGNGSILDQLANQGEWIQLPNASGLLFPVPMLPRSFYGVHPYGRAVAIMHQSVPPDDESGHFRVRKVASDGKVIFARNYSYSPRALPDGYVDEFVNSRFEDLQRARGAQAASLAREAERLISSRVSRFEPPVTEVLMGADGSIWLRREAYEADSVLWWVLDERGDLVAQLRLPARLKIRYADRDAVWGIEYDDLDVNYVVKYRIQR